MVIQLKRINWSLLICHFLASPFLILGVQQLQLIKWVPFVKLYQQAGVEGVAQQGNLTEIIAELWMGPRYALVLAVLASCVLSAVVVWHRRESWLIPVFLFVLGISSSWTRYYTSEFVFNMLAHSRLSVESQSMEMRLAIAGIMLVSIGLIPFLLTWKTSRLKIKSG